MRRLLLVIAVTLAACGDDGNINDLADAPEFPDDTDGDGVPDAVDNCDAEPNANQVNTDGDGEGDACDADDDNDTIADAADNCPLVANTDQANADGDGDGDACDDDADGDTIANAADNCPLAANTDQLNTDADTEGDVCDADDDNDAILDAVDNCALIANADQANTDADAAGNACDDDDDNDTLLDAADNCPLDVNLDQANLDGDGAGDVCDPDDDNDTIADVLDNCPVDANTDQTNSDTDANGDACDTDDDDDSIDDDDDNCPIDANDQSDLDEDGAGDVCDPDDDNDAVDDVDDNCPTDFNDGQENADSDGLGDACDPDDDNDTIEDGSDNCPTIANDQTDNDEDGVGNECDNCVDVFNSDQSDADADGRGDLCEALDPTFNDTIIGGNIAAKGVAWAGRETGQPITQASIALVGVPAGATIQRALLYWTVIGAPFPTVTMNGTAVTGIEIGQAPDTCWGIGNNFMYRADVTSLVPGDGTYLLTDILSTTGAPADGQGATLVVVYADPNDSRNNLVTINDGSIGFVQVGQSGSSVASGFDVEAGFDRATAITIVADGQTFPDDVLYQGLSFGQGDAYFGNEGSLWDTRFDDISGVIGGGTTSITTEVTSQSDCLAWSMSAIVIEDIDDPGNVEASVSPQTLLLTPGGATAVKSMARRPSISDFRPHTTLRAPSLQLNTTAGRDGGM